MSLCPVTGFDCVTCEDGKCALAPDLKLIKAPRGEGNGYNFTHGEKAGMTPDHLAILTVARAAIEARDDRTAWRKNVAHAAEIHGAFCDDLWAELERQLDIQDGKIPTLEHPSVKRIRMAANMRSEIVNVAAMAIESALNELVKGPMMDDYE